MYRERESEKFLRDRIWYKQNKFLAMTPLKIAREWAKRFPNEIDLEVIEKLTRDEESLAHRARLDGYPSGGSPGRSIVPDCQSGVGGSKPCGSHFAISLAFSIHINDANSH